MPDHAAQVRSALAKGPMPSESLRAALGVSRPTLARVLATMPGEIVTWGAARATRYALRDRYRGLVDIPVYRVTAAGYIVALGLLVPVRPDGFLMARTGGVTEYFEGLPWWLVDVRPQGFLGWAWVHRYAAGLGLAADVRHWSDTDALHALLAHGGDAVGNLLLGDLARDQFVNTATAIAAATVSAKDWPRLAARALTPGESWSSAGGEQPKFCAHTRRGHVLVKFTVAADNPVAGRWRDLLLAEHLALETLATGVAGAVASVNEATAQPTIPAPGLSAARSRLIDVGSQRFLELERFDRVGTHGRRGLLSLAALDGAFVGNATAPWPVLTADLARQQVITPQAHAGSALLYAFGTLIGNTDMHGGNLSFVGDSSEPWSLSPAYDMLPMAFAPGAGGVLRDTLAPARLHPSVNAATWRVALLLAQQYLERLAGGTTGTRKNHLQFSKAFTPCLQALTAHMQDAAVRIARLG